MRTPVAAYVALALAVAACSSQSAANDRIIVDPPMFSVAQVELSEDGGLGGFSTTQAVRHDTRSFGYARRRICQQPACAAPLDSAAGTLSPAAADSLFDVVLGQSLLSLKDDYGRTQGGADMVTYTLRMTTSTGPKTVAADDGTMPPPMRRIVEAVHATISAARR